MVSLSSPDVGEHETEEDNYKHPINQTKSQNSHLDLTI